MSVLQRGNTFHLSQKTKKLNFFHFPLTLHVQKVKNTLLSDLGISGTFFMCACAPGVHKLQVLFKTQKCEISGYLTGVDRERQVIIRIG